MSRQEQRQQIDRSHPELSISEQCAALGIARSTLYYKPRTANEEDLRIMRLMEGLHLEDPARGTRRMRDDLRDDHGVRVGRAKVRTLMRRMRMGCVYRRPRTTVIEAALAPARAAEDEELAGEDAGRVRGARLRWQRRYTAILLTADIAVVCGAVLLAQFIRFGEDSLTSGPEDHYATVYSVLIATLWLTVLAGFHARSAKVVGRACGFSPWGLTLLTASACTAPAPSNSASAPSHRASLKSMGPPLLRRQG